MNYRKSNVKLYKKVLETDPLGMNRILEGKTKIDDGQKGQEVQTSRKPKVIYLANNVWSK